MPAIYDSLVGDGLTPHVAWRVAFVVPGICITAVALALLLLCEDTPTGEWSERFQAAENNMRRASVQGTVVDVPAGITGDSKRSGSSSPTNGDVEEKKADPTGGASPDAEAQTGDQQIISSARGEVIQKPSLKEIAKLCASPQTWVLGACYFCTFGAELSINSILGTYYGVQFKKDHLTLQESSNWAAMFGLMNALFRPLGGFASDYLYRSTKSVWAKKMLVHAYSIIAGAFLLAIGLTNPTDLATMVCLVGVGFAFFLEGANGGVFSLVPHVHPYANGVVSGFTGASGNFGGIIFSIIFKYNFKDYAKSIWIIGVIMIAINVAVCWIKPIPKGQAGGR